MSKLKKYNIFLTFSSFAKGMIEIFIPLIMYERGYDIKKILIFLLIKFLFAELFLPISAIIGKKINFKNLIILSNFLFIGMNIYFNFINFKFYELMIFAILYASYLMFYWMGRHIYGMSIIEDKKTTENVSLYTIFTLLGTLPAAYTGALILNNFGFTVLSIILLIIATISVIPLYFIREEASKEKLNFKKIFKNFPIKNYIFIFLEQIKHLAMGLFPLYVYLEISKKYEFIGMSNAIICIASIIYVYFLAKVMDKNKKDYLSLLCLLLAVTWIFKLNIYSKTIILFIMFFEGVFTFGLETIILRNIYSYGKEYKVLSYNLFMEALRNTSRVIILTIFILLSINLKTILYIAVSSLFLNSIILFDDGKYGYKKRTNL